MVETQIKTFKNKSKKKSRGRMHLNLRSGKENMTDPRKKQFRITIIRNDPE